MKELGKGERNRTTKTMADGEMIIKSDENYQLRRKKSLFYEHKNVILLLLWMLVVMSLVTRAFGQRSNNQNAKLDEDLSFSYGNNKPVLDDPLFSSSRTTATPVSGSGGRRGQFRSTRTSSSRAHLSKSPSTPKLSTSRSPLSPILTSQLLGQNVFTPPFTYSSETLNQTHANMFKGWLDSKSDELFELSMNYSGFKLLNETYNVHLSKDAQFAWINFTEMIMNISNRISQVLHHKTLIVQNLTDLVEKAFNDYRQTPDKILASTNFLYYDAKSPNTFCDIQEKVNSIITKQQSKLNDTFPDSTTTTTTTVSSPTVNASSSTRKSNQSKVTTASRESPTDHNQTIIHNDDETSLSSKNESSPESLGDTLKNYEEIRFYKKRRDIQQDVEVDFDDSAGDDQLDMIEFDYAFDRHVIQPKTTTKYYSYNTSYQCPYPSVLPHRHRNNNNKTDVLWQHHLVKRQNAPGGQKEHANTAGGRVKGSHGSANRRPQGPGGGRSRKPTNATRTTTTPSTTTSTFYDDDSEERTDLETYDHEFIDDDILLGRSPYWNMTCMNRSFDENFKNLPNGVNRNKSTVHVPTNVYKQELEINMTAYWTEALDDLFKSNYDNDNEIFWQYFCSSNGLFRRYPGAYWTKQINQKQDFFDCRLQSWYIMAAASPKDVLILLDSSGSMTGLRFEIAKKLIEAILDTLSDNDFFNILTFSNTVDYLMNLRNETKYRNRFIQAGRTNKQTYIEKLKWFKDTKNIANVSLALTKSFELLLSKDLHTDSCQCNKVIMVITDGASENGEEVFRKYNWNNGRQVRVFTFLIGRDMIDPRQVEWMACANDGKFFHVATLADVNEHVHEYIPVLSQPMALKGHHETTWSNVFIGYLDKELKIAVARPAFKTIESLLSKEYLKPKSEEYFKRKKVLTTTTTPPLSTEPAEYNNEYYNDAYYDSDYDERPESDKNSDETAPKEDDKPIKETVDKDLDAAPVEDYKVEDDLEEENMLKLADGVLRKQQVLLGVVGVDVPVLRLISKVSPKYQMGVGIYIIMLDNNGFIVFHPSIKKEIANTQSDYKGTSSSINLDRFEIPIDNEEEFEQLQHEMIDQLTNNKTLDNWKREGLRVIRRRTEYVYTHVNKTPFSVAIASPSSFGRYYIDLPRNVAEEYDKTLKELIKNNINTNIQLYNCSYSYLKLGERTLNLRLYNDFCIKYLLHDTDQVLAIKSDLVLHNIYYNHFNFSLFHLYPNLVKASFYGTYSGITFYLPVTFYKTKPGTQIMPFQMKPFTSKQSPTTLTEKSSSSQTSTDATTSSSTASSSTKQTTPLVQQITKPEMTEPASEMTINVEIGSILEPFFNTSTKPTVLLEKLNQQKNWHLQLNNSQANLTLAGGNESETYVESSNVFSSESNKHTYSFEKQYYTRSIEFSDYLRTEFNLTEPIVNYFLNESSKEARRDTISATLPIWLGKVPTAVAGVVYDAHLLQSFLFENYMMPDCDHITCRNLCSNKRGMNLTCYLVDEHGIVVLSTQDNRQSTGGKASKEPIIAGQPLYKVNPWLMKTLEFQGVYDLVIPGKNLPECRELPRTINNSSKLRNLVYVFVNGVCVFLVQLFQSLLFYLIYGLNLSPSGTSTVHASIAQPTLADRINTYNKEFRAKNSHCYYFGVYSFNLTKWKTLDSSLLHVWCNSTNNVQRQYLVGYFKYSNLIMLVVEDEYELIHCGNITQLIGKFRQSSPAYANKTENLTDPSVEILSETSSGGSGPADEAFKTTTLIGGDSGGASFDFNYTDQYNHAHNYQMPFNLNESNQSNLTYFEWSSSVKNDFTINRYRKKPNACFNFFEKEKDYLPCVSHSRARSITIINAHHCLFSALFATITSRANCFLIPLLLTIINFLILIVTTTSIN